VNPSEESKQEQMHLFVFKLVWGLFVVTAAVLTIALVSAPQSTGDREGVLAPDIKMPMIIAAVSTWLAALLVPKIIYSLAIKRVKVKSISVFFVPWLIRMTFFECVSMYGFVLAFVERDWQLYLPFAGAALAGFLISFPSEERLRALFNSKSLADQGRRL
jgi:hypothetical protein